MKAEHFRFRHTTAITNDTVTFVCYAFVDDTNLVHTFRTEEHQQEMQTIIDHWEGGLCATGGALRADKSYWYFIKFKWANNKWKYCTSEDKPAEITMHKHDGTRELVKRLKVEDACKTIGVFMAMDGNFNRILTFLTFLIRVQLSLPWCSHRLRFLVKQQTQELIGKAKQFADCVRTGRLSPIEAEITLNSTIMKTLEYPMEAISLTKHPMGQNHETQSAALYFQKWQCKLDTP